MDQAQQLRNIVKAKDLAAKEKKARVITVTSGKGGVGKSNTTVNLAIELSKMGKSVIIFDADFGLANVEVMFGALPKYNLSDLLFKGKSIEEIITPGPENIRFISGGSGILGLNDLAPDQISFLIRNMTYLDHIADVILIDTGAGISDQVLQFVISSPEVLIVTTPDPSSLTDSYSLLKTLFKNPDFDPVNSKFYVLANKVSSIEDGDTVFQKLSSVVTKFLGGELDYIGMIPADSAIEKSIRQQKPVTISYPDAKSSQAYQVLASNLENGERTKFEMKSGFSSLFSDFFGRH